MMRKVRIDDGGDTKLITGSLIDKSELRANEGSCWLWRHRMESIANLPPPCSSHGYHQKASLATDSFMSAASFRETTRVLTEAAIKR